jgi:hypothetical protein
MVPKPEGDWNFGKKNLVLLPSGLSLRWGSPSNWEVFRGVLEGTNIAKFGDE